MAKTILNNKRTYVGINISDLQLHYIAILIKKKNKNKNKTTLRVCLTPDRMSINQKPTNANEGMDKRKLLHTIGRNVN